MVQIFTIEEGMTELLLNGEGNNNSSKTAKKILEREIKNLKSVYTNLQKLAQENSSSEDTAVRITPELQKVYEKLSSKQKMIYERMDDSNKVWYLGELSKEFENCDILFVMAVITTAASLYIVYLIHFTIY